MQIASGKRVAKKIIVLTIVSILLVQYGTATSFAQVASNPVWETCDLNKIYYYMAEHYDKETQSWKLDEDFNSADESIAQQIMAFTNDIQNIQEGPIGETSFSRLLEIAKLVSSLASGNFAMVATELAISNLPKEIREDAKMFFVVLIDITETVVDALKQAKNYPSAKEIIDAKNIDFKALGAIGFLAETIVNLAGFIDTYNRHCWIVEQVEVLPIEGTDLVKNIKTAIVSYELAAEEKGILYDIFGWAFQTLGQTLGSVAFAKLGAVVGGAVGDGLGIVAGLLVGSFVGSWAGTLIADEIAERLQALWIESGILLEGVIDKFWRFYRDTHIGAEIVDVWTWTLSGRGDNRMLKIIPGDFVYVKIRNTGEFEETFVISPFVEDGQWTILHSNWIGNLIDLANILVGNFQRIIEIVTLEPDEEVVIPLVAIPYGWPLSEDIPHLPTFYPQATVGFSLWHEASGRHLDAHKETMYSQDEDPGATFEVKCEPEMPFYGLSEDVSIDIRIQNTGTKTAYDLLAYIYISYFEQSPMLLTIHGRTQLDGEGSKEEWWIFSHDWAVPADAGVGPAVMDVRIFGADTPGGTQREYGKVAIQKNVFDVYKLNIITPTSSGPAIAGDPNNPVPISVAVTGLPSRIWLSELPSFSVKIGTEVAGFQQVDSSQIPFGVYVLKVASPPQITEGKYDLEITATFDGTTDTDTELQSVQYTTAPSPEPIGKGLDWLRTRQYVDGSWRSSVGVTSLAALAFLNTGYDETDTAVSKAINYILSKVNSDGSIYTSYSVYETSIAILPLVATRNENYATIIENAKNWLVEAQQDEDFGYTPTNYQYGGWTYWSGKGDPDLSNTQFALLGLDAANLPKTDPTWTKAIIFTQRCQNRPASNDQAWAHDSTRPSYNDGGFIYRPWGWSLAGGTTSYGSMTGAGIWGLLLSGVPKTDERVVAAMNWVKNHYTWNVNPGIGWWRPYYYYLSMSKALTMYGQTMIDQHDWYQELYDKIVGMQIDAAPGQGYWSTSAEDYNPELTTAYAILSLQTRAVAPPVQRLSYLTFILRSNCFLRILDSEGNLVGYNYMTGLGENNIPTAVYSGPFSGPQYVVIVNPEAGTYDLELIGISEGPYDLTIQGNYGEEATDSFEYTGEIGPAELHGTDVTVTAIVGPVDVYADPPEFEEIIDNTPPEITVITPSEDPPQALQDGVTLEATVSDPSGVDWVTFSIREPDGTIIDPMFESMDATDVGSDIWQAWVDTNVPELPDGHYLLLVNASDMLGNEGSKTVQFSIRNWACLELLPATEANKAGRTMPVKFSLRVFENVDPAQPFVYNEELTIVIYEEGHPESILQESTYGDTARDYRIDSIGELYITNFRTIRKKLTIYVVEIYRKDMLIGSFTFETVK